MLLTLPPTDVRDVLADHRWRHFCTVRALATLWREGHASVHCTMAAAHTVLAADVALNGQRSWYFRMNRYAFRIFHMSDFCVLSGMLRIS